MTEAKPTEAFDVERARGLLTASAEQQIESCHLWSLRAKALHEACDRVEALEGDGHRCEATTQVVQLREERDQLKARIAELERNFSLLTGADPFKAIEAQRDQLKARVAKLEVALTKIQDGWKHASDCDAEFPGHEKDEWGWCDCYRGVARKALARDEAK